MRPSKKREELLLRPDIFMKFGVVQRSGSLDGDPANSGDAWTTGGSGHSPRWRWGMWSRYMIAHSGDGDHVAARGHDGAAAAAAVAAAVAAVAAKIRPCSCACASRTEIRRRPPPHTAFLTRGTAWNLKRPASSRENFGAFPEAEFAVKKSQRALKVRWLHNTNCRLLTYRNFYNAARRINH